MGVAENLTGRKLKGRARKEWTVIERVKQDEDRSAMFHSVGYKVVSSENQVAFMKVTDLDLMTDDTVSMLQRVQVAIQAHTIERQMLEHCRGNNKDRIVLAIDVGEEVIEAEGVKQPIFYLIFELAECDVRVQVDRRVRFEQVWTYGALHDLAVAIQQLHRGKVSHNDIKPENFLVFRDVSFRDRLQKLADLGCATSPLIASIYDDAICAGDRRYAAPETLYCSGEDDEMRSFESRRIVDLYHLGSMLFFLVTGRMLTPEIVRNLAPEHRPILEEEDRVDTLREVLPYWREAFARVIEEFDSKLPKDKDGKRSEVGAVLLSTLLELAEPDPKLRGHPQNRKSDQASVQQYITLFDKLRKRSMN